MRGQREIILIVSRAERSSGLLAEHDGIISILQNGTIPAYSHFPKIVHAVLHICVVNVLFFFYNHKCEYIPAEK